MSRDELTDLITKLEVTIDYPEEDLEDLTMSRLGKDWTVSKRAFPPC